MKNKNKTVNNFKKNSKKWMFTLSAFAVVVVIAILLIINLGLGDNSVVARVHGEPISYSEFQNGLESNRALVYGYFKGKYDADDSKNFWTTNFDGEIPLEKIKKDALDDCVENKSKLIMAKDMGLVKDISYKKFLKDLKAENKRRKTAIEKNEVIYGPIEYGEAEYYGVINSNIFSKLEETYTKDLTYTEEELKKYYTENKEDEFKSEDELKIIKISVPYLSTDKATKEAAKKLIDNVKRNIEAGMDIKTATNDESIVFEEQLLDQKGKHSYSLLNPNLISKAVELDTGDVTEVVDEGGAFNIAHCIEKSNKGYLVFNEGAMESIRRTLAKKEYDAVVEKKIKDLDVVINEKVYNQISANDVNGSK